MYSKTPNSPPLTLKIQENRIAAFIPRLLLAATNPCAKVMNNKSCSRYSPYLPYLLFEKKKKGKKKRQEPLVPYLNK